MLIHVFADRPSRLSTIREIVEPRHRIIAIDEVSASQAGDIDLLIIDIDLRDADAVEQARALLRHAGQVHHRLFVVDEHSHTLQVQAYALGATHTIFRPLDPQSLLHELAMMDPWGNKRKPGSAAGASLELRSSAAIFASMFSAMLGGRPIVVSDARQATQQIIDSVTSKGLSAWLDEVRRYHESTFQHCLLVSGVAVGFALNLGFAVADVHRLGLAATLHDIGKANIPLAVLDKPGRLDSDEEKLMRQHPVIGYDALKQVSGIDGATLDAVRHHHELLDGSGYPDQLTAPAIADIVRLLTISDIFGALIESRPYRAAMSRQKAYDVLCDMGGKLEPALVRAFKPIALSA